MSSAHPTPCPGFFWHGVLIVLPAVVLTVLAFVALRHDRLLARQQATEQAARLAQHAANVLLPEALAVPLPSSADLEALPRLPDEEVVFAFAHRPPGWIAWQTDTRGALIYPPPEAALLPAEDTAIEGLTEEQRTCWNVAETGAFQGNNPQGATAELRRFLGLDPPPRFAAQALYQQGVLSLQSGNAPMAREAFARVQREFGALSAKTGIPLDLYSGLHLLELSRQSGEPAERRKQLLHRICAEVILHFPLLAPAFLDRLESLDDTSQVPLWREVFETHQQARQFAAAWRHPNPPVIEPDDDTAPRWMDFAAHGPWLVRTAPEGSNRWFFALSEPKATDWVKRTLEALALPPYFGLRVHMAGRELHNEPGEEFATTTRPASPAIPGIQISVLLIQPDLLYGPQRARTYWLSAVIGLSTVTILIGFLAAQRAFRRQQELSEMKGNFVSSVSHELRAPIASVRLMAEELNDLDDGDREKSRRYHGFIVQECRRLSRLIENVLDFARHEQGRKEYQFEPIDLPGLVEATAKLMSTYATEKEITIKTQISHDVGEIEADGQALQQVLVNLIDNAIKHSPPGAAVTVGFTSGPALPSRDQPDRSLAGQRAKSLFSSHDLHSPESIVRLWVEDHGPGIPPEEHERIFKRFYRLGSELRRETQGVGLGLAIVKQVTEAHGGRVIVESAVGHGSRFTVELPLRPPRSSNALP